MTAFINEFIQYLISFIILVVLAVAGVFTGIAMKKRKLAKEANEISENE